MCHLLVVPTLVLIRVESWWCRQLLSETVVVLCRSLRVGPMWARHCWPDSFSKFLNSFFASLIIQIYSVYYFVCSSNKIQRRK
ncbi:unnamed protein product [Brassica rapa subsp. narinosa]